MSLTQSSSHILFISPTVISGEEYAQPYVADVLISGGRIARIAQPGTLSDQLGAEVRKVEARGYVLCPGFIDLHAHSDLYLLTHPDHEAKISQGCTTEVVGQDGISYAPVQTKAQMKAIREQITGWNGNPNEEDHPGVGLFEWNTVGEYLDCLERNKTATNVAMLVPQGNLRLLACGPWDEVATADEITVQEKLLRQAMLEGAVGMSSGLTYTPGMYASTSELARLCRVLGEEFPAAFYAPHHRSYGFKALESYAEMLGLGRDTGCPIHLTHATLNFSENKGKAPLLISMIDAARSDGCDISLDTYPYLPGCTTLAALLPSWASSGGPVETLKRLQDEISREKIRRAVEDTGCDGGHGIPTNWDEIQIGSTTHPDLASYSGRRVSEVARSLKVPSIKVFFDVLIKDKLATSCIMHIGNEENVREIMCHETHCSGSDAILHGKTLHPRAYGTFPRFLGHYSRDLGIMPLPAMVAHLTSRPAKRLGIYPSRGLIAEGSAADIVLFDPETIKDKATYENPKQKAEGVRFVLVNGEVAVDETRLTGTRGGKVLRRREDGKVR
ncbi:D-aminoacylase [Cryptococcus neoformans C23]|uniref:D-aminoacylase n=1 Tax=Cryptococcus neoformans (strain H99 / ATCC 208821 / CBS 10515 / FGSC 9487) TaxID=235443 RepID=J9VX90_CRYN9|nr:D-aminoacylase [Cryptococcus neoformans var. grubii H99]AUB27234.1 D-aminoacylase [Cryptococcus neoformans var. grubii]OWZ40896.1 D-aminoacylase [Cryptococcus neoformans var. grubii C23]OXC82701.1 D-aminoacylase [Cryptococcus neoformans var. grubii AD1-7a]AFR97239.1 D-aminoacylase [Cryptococcus neoformans var. grubii H99]OXH27345.1 D-aminoacylase [Cryptococcus neoformans var. grubii]|eukprot:XP_012051854.1 D-aminoacylase [Cryptococcus neoformans var. grubii H99]